MLCRECGCELTQNNAVSNKLICKPCQNLYMEKWRLSKGIKPRVDGPKYDLTTEKFGRLTPVSHFKKGRNTYWHCQCECGKTTNVFQNHLRKGNIRSCGCLRVELASGRHHEGAKKENNGTWTGYGDIYGSYFYQIKRGAETRDIAFNVTIEELDNLLKVQNHTCALSGVPIALNHTKDFTASLDRIDSTKPYDIENVQWLHKDINKMKHNLNQARFIELAELIARHKGDNNAQRD